MKRRFVLALAIWWGWQAHAQGTFTFSNPTGPNGFDALVYTGGGAIKLEGPNVVAAVFLNGVQLGAAVPFRTGAGAGYWDAGVDNLRVVPGSFSGDVVSGFMLRVWDATKGADVRTARDLGGKAGLSEPFSIRLGGPRRDTSQPDDPPGVMSNFKAFSADGNLYYLDIPEPPVLSLGALGVIVMWILRRSKPLVGDGCRNEINP